MKHIFKQIVLSLSLVGMIIVPLVAMNFIDCTTSFGWFAIIVSIGVAASGVVFYKKYSDFQKTLNKLYSVSRPHQ